MSAAAGPSRELLDALDAAVERRAKTGWKQADSARGALTVVQQDAGGRRPGRQSGDPNSTFLDGITRHFGLSESQHKILEVATAAEHTTALHLLFGLLSGDEKPARPTVALVLELAGVAPTDERASEVFSALSPLVRYGLLEIRGDDVLLSRRVCVPDRVVAHLAGDDRPLPSVLAMRTEAVPTDVEGATVLADAIDSGLSFAWVHGPFGSAAEALAAAACERLGVPCVVADLALRPIGMPPDDAAADLILEAALTGSVLILSSAEQASQSALERTPLMVIAVSTEPWDPARASQLPLTIAAPRLTVAERAELWRGVLNVDKVDREISALRLAPEQIVAVGRRALQLAELARDPGVSLSHVRTAARQLGKGRAVRANASASVGLEDLVLPPHALTEVQRLMDWARYRDEVTSRGALHGKGGKGTGICALFTGKPGTGKTLAAHVIADSLAMDLYQVDLSTVVDKYIGETEKNLEKTFQEAEAMNAVLFFDEADSIFGSRSAVNDARDRYANQEIAYLLQRMEQFDGITVLATNLRGNLDPAFARRLHFIISFPDPDEATRVQLWEHHFAEVGDVDLDDPVDVDWLSKTVELAGGDIRNIVLSAVYAAVAAEELVGMRHVLAAVRREFIKLGRRIPPHIEAGPKAALPGATAPTSTESRPVETRPAQPKGPR